MAGEQQKYSFEDAPVAESHRARDTALADLRTLLVRMEVDAGELERLCAAPLLVRYAMDVPLNIAWYERAKRRAVAKQKLGLVGVILFGVVAMAVTAVPALVGEADRDAPVAITQVAIFVGMAYGVLQVIASLTDQKAKLAGFSKASADLKESLFTFEETWRKKPLLDGDALGPDFESALLQEIGNARRTARAEREAYFTSGASPVDVASSFGGALEAVGRSTQALGELRSDRAELAESQRMNAVAPIASERQRLIETKATAEGRRERLARMQREGGTEEQLAAAKSELLDAEIAVVEAQARFDMCVKGEMLNPR